MKNKKSSPKTFLGMPMNWNHKDIFRTMWSEDDDRVFPPKSFGIGWTINFHALLKASGLISNNDSTGQKKKGKE